MLWPFPNRQSRSIAIGKAIGYKRAISSITTLRGRKGGGREEEGERREEVGREEGRREERRQKGGGRRREDDGKIQGQYFGLTVSSSSQWPVHIWCRGPEG